MRKTWKLAVVLLKGGGALTTKKRERAWVLPAVLALSFAIFATSMVQVTLEMYKALAPLGAADVILPLAFGATSIVIFVFGIFYTVSVMYHASDIHLLLALPLRPYQILGGKLITLVVYEYILEAFILIPLLIGFGMASGAGLVFVVYALVLFLLTPLIALCMAAVIVMVVMRFTSFGKNKQAFKFVGGILAMAIAVGLNVALQSGAAGISEAQLAAIATGQSSLVSVVSNIFPGVVFASNALILSREAAGLLNFALFALCCAAAAAVFIGVGQLVYFKGLSGVSEASAKRREMSGEALYKRTQRGGAAASYVKKELRLLVRSPIAFLNCVLVNVIWPVILVALLLGRSSSLGGISQLAGSADAGLLIAVLAGLAAFTSATNAVTSTAISREGKGLYFMKYVPMDIGRQIWAKVASGLLISSIGVVLLMVAAVVIGVEIWTALGGLVLGLLAMAAVSVVGVLIDSARPKLNWMNEQQAIKQNLNVVLHTLCGLGLAVAVILPVVLAGMPGWLAVVYTAAVTAGLLALTARLVKTRAKKQIAQMDV